MNKTSKKSNSLYESDILKSKAPKKNELLEYLENLHRDLSSVEQDIQYAPKGLHATATQLVQSKYMENSDRDVRILVTCCVVDVLRIYAPEAPYKDEDMIRVFEAIAKQILSLQTTDVSSPAGKRILYILSSIATVKSCLVPVLLDQKGIRSASEVVEELFSAVTSIVDSSATEEVFTSVCEILQSCIEEYNNISPELLEILLVAILPAQKAENPMLYRVIATVLHTVSPIIMGTLTSIMSSILVGPGNQFQGKLSEIADDVYALIYELHLISPALMQGILPSLTSQLRSEDDSTRTKVVQLLGKVYLTENSTYHQDFPRYFRDFIGRMGDSLVAIRNEVIEYSCLLMSRGIEVKYISEILSHRLRDPDEDVRKKAVTKLFRQVFDNIEMSDSLLLSALFDRVKDKVVDIRKAAMVGMSKIYWKYVSSRLPALSDFEFTDLDSVKEQIPSSVMDKLQSVPGTLIKCWGYPDMETRHATLQLTQEFLLPKQLYGGHGGEINGIRLSAMLLMYALLGDEEKPFFEAILTFKARINSYVMSLLSLKKGGRDSFETAANTNGNSSEQRTIAQLKQLLSKLTLLLPTTENKKSGFFDRLVTTKDKSVWKLLEHATETNWAIEENTKFKDDLMKKLDSKSPLAEFISMIYDMASYQLVTSPMVDALLRAVLGSKFVSNAGIPEVLSMLSKHCPKLFANTSPVLREWIDSTLLKSDDKGKKRQVKLEYFEHGIDVINHVAPYLSEAEEVEKLGRALLEGLRDCSDETAVTLAGSAMRSILSAQESLSSRFLRDVVKYIKDITSVRATTPKFMMLMKSIASLLELSPRLMDKKDTKVLAMQTMYAVFSNNTRNLLVQHLRKELSESLTAESPVEICASMMRLLTRLAIFEDTAEEIKLEAGFEFLVDIDRVVDFNNLVSSLFECMEEKGKSFQTYEPLNEDDATVLYQQASLCAMSMIATAGFATIPTERWHELGFSLLHEDHEFQVTLLSELNDIIKVQQVPLRFLAYPCLVAHDAHIAKLAREGLTTAITRLRRTHEDVASKLVTVNDANERMMLQQQAAETMPENIMPYLLHILTYHPDFPTSVAATSAEDKARIKLVVSCIRMLVQVLQSKLKVPTSNLPFLFKQLNTINHRFVDRLDPNNVGLHFVTHLTVRLLQEQVKTAENLHVYPGEVFLPRDLYEGIEAGKAQLQLGMIATGGRTDVPNMLDMAEFAIDQVMQVASKGRDKSGTTTNASPPFKVRSGLGVSHVGAGRGLSPERKRAASKTKVNRFLSFDDREDDEDEEDKPKRKGKASKQLPPEQPSRSLPSRGAKANIVSYMEPEEMTDRDMDKLNRDAEKKRKSSESVGREASVSPSKRMRISSSFGGNDISNANVNNTTSILSTSFALTTTGRPSLKSAAAAATKQDHAEEFYDLFASQPSVQGKEKTRDSIVKNTSKSASTDAEQGNTSPTENDTESPAVLSSRSVRQSNRVLSERNSNIQQSAASSSSKPRASQSNEIATSSNGEDSALPSAGKGRTRGRAKEEEQTVIKATGKRTRQLRA